MFIFGMAPLFLFFIAHFAIPESTIQAKSPGVFLERQRQGISREDFIIADEESIGAVCWQLKRNDVYLLGGPGELDYGLGYKDARGRRLDMESVSDFIHKNREKTVLIARAENLSRWRVQLPEPLIQEWSGPLGYIVWRY